MKIDSHKASPAADCETKDNNRRLLARILEYIDEQDFYRLTAFHAGYEAGSKSYKG